MKITPESVAAVDEAIASRRSVRAFLPTPVARETVEQILAVATRAPSGTNTRPWHVHLLTGQAKAALSAKIRAACDDPAERATLDYGMFLRNIMVSLGHADPTAVENSLVTEREPVAGFTRFHP